MKLITMSMNEIPVLTYDVIVAVLMSTLGLLRRRRLVRGFQLSADSRGLLADLLLVMPDLDPLAKIILPLLPHAWPVQNAATKGRLDVIEYVHSRGHLGDTSKPHKARVQAILTAANAAEHLHILRWLLDRWPSLVQAEVWSAQQAILGAANLTPQERAVNFLNFWVHETGLLQGDADQIQAVLTDEVVYKSIEAAFKKERLQVLEWWGQHTQVSRQASLWDWFWVYSAIQTVSCPVLALCADLEDAGKIHLTQTRWNGTQSASDLHIGPTDTLSSCLMDMASMPSVLSKSKARSHVDVLRFWKQRQEVMGRPLVYSGRAIEYARAPEVLDWWFKESQLPLEYSTKVALNCATSKRSISILDWWLQAWKENHVPELDYDESIMIRATTYFCTSDVDGNVIRLVKNPQGHVKWRPDAADWWDKSGLDLKVPGPNSPFPSVVDVCAWEAGLSWWLQRARRLKAKSAAAGRADMPLVAFFPYYTTAAIYRAAYWGSTGVVLWWNNVYKKGILPPCDPFTPSQPYSAHRLVELAAMCEDEWSYDFNLRQVLGLFPSSKVTFRGSLIEWAKLRVLRPENPLPDYGPTTVRQVCDVCGIDPENGGLPPPEEGYVRQGNGEDMVFGW